MEAVMKSIETTCTPANLFQSLARRWQRHAAQFYDPYRPELHYMRGPGPRSREKLGLPANFDR
jgi:hypothetical protein